MFAVETAIPSAALEMFGFNASDANSGRMKVAGWEVIISNVIFVS